MKFFLSLFILFIFHIHCPAQNGIITGNVEDKENTRALPGVTVLLTAISEPLFSASQVSDQSGTYNFEKVPDGLYRLSFKMTGYVALRIDSIHVRADRNDFNIGTLLLVRSATELEEVVVYTEKPLIENKDGKLIFNASESALSNSSTTTELLKQTPLVSVDTDGKILMRGKEVKILIDDKPVELDSRQLQDLLESMPGSMIEKIEVLTTPPPQYANERGGVINIVTRKGKGGMTARVNVNYGSRGELGGNGNFSYRKNKSVINLVAGYTHNRYRSNSHSTRQNFYADSSNQFKTLGKNSSSNKRPNARFTLDYDANKRNSYNLTLLFNANDNEGRGITEYSNINRYDVLYKLSQRSVASAAESYNPSAHITYLHKGKDPAESFRIHGGVNFNDYENVRNFYQQYLNPDYTFTGNDSSQQQLSTVKSYTVFMRANYDKPIKANRIFLNAGATLNRLVSHNKLHTFFLKKPENVFLNNEVLSNNFKFYQDIYGVRLAVRYQFNKDFFANLGLLTEYAETSFDIVNNVETYGNEYVSLLPFVNLTKKWESGYNITGSYKRSVQRPGINNLNPSIDYADPYNTRFGNPFLKPYFADNIDLGAGYWNKSFNLNLALGYNVLRQIYSSIRTLQPDGKTTTTWQNLSGREEYEASFWGGLTVNKKARANASVGYTYNVYSLHDRRLNKYRNGGSLHSSLNGSYQINNLLNATGNLTYNRFANPQGTVRNAVSMVIGVQQKLFQKNMTISASIVDPFREQQNRNFINGPNYTLQSLSTSNSRNFKIGVGYTFKKMVKKKKGGDKLKDKAVGK